MLKVEIGKFSINLNKRTKKRKCYINRLVYNSRIFAFLLVKVDADHLEVFKLLLELV